MKSMLRAALEALSKPDSGLAEPRILPELPSDKAHVSLWKLALFVSLAANAQIHSELELEVPVEHGLLLENLLDLAHAPFTHTSTFAKGWPIPDVVRFNAARLLGGNWEPYPIDMSFEPPCMVLSTIGASPGIPSCVMQLHNPALFGPVTTEAGCWTCCSSPLRLVLTGSGVSKVMGRELSSLSSQERYQLH